MPINIQHGPAAGAVASAGYAGGESEARRWVEQLKSQQRAQAEADANANFRQFTGIQASQQAQQYDAQQRRLMAELVAQQQLARDAQQFGYSQRMAEMDWGNRRELSNFDAFQRAYLAQQAAEQQAARDQYLAGVNATEAEREFARRQALTGQELATRERQNLEDAALRRELANQSAGLQREMAGQELAAQEARDYRLADINAAQAERAFGYQNTLEDKRFGQEIERLGMTQDYGREMFDRTALVNAETAEQAFGRNQDMARLNAELQGRQQDRGFLQSQIGAGLNFERQKELGDIAYQRETQKTDLELVQEEAGSVMKWLAAQKLTPDGQRKAADLRRGYYGIMGSKVIRRPEQRVEKLREWLTNAANSGIDNEVVRVPTLAEEYRDNVLEIRDQDGKPTGMSIVRQRDGKLDVRRTRLDPTTAKASQAGDSAAAGPMSRTDFDKQFSAAWKEVESERMLLDDPTVTTEMVFGRMKQKEEAYQQYRQYGFNGPQLRPMTTEQQQLLEAKRILLRAEDAVARDPQALARDPQAAQLVEQAWLLLHRAGIDPSQIPQGARDALRRTPPVAKPELPPEVVRISDDEDFEAKIKAGTIADGSLFAGPDGVMRRYVDQRAAAAKSDTVSPTGVTTASATQQPLPSPAPEPPQATQRAKAPVVGGWGFAPPNSGDVPDTTQPKRLGQKVESDTVSPNAGDEIEKAKGVLRAAVMNPSTLSDPAKRDEFDRARETLRGQTAGEAASQQPDETANKKEMPLDVQVAIGILKDHQAKYGANIPPDRARIHANAADIYRRWKEKK